MSEEFTLRGTQPEGRRGPGKITYVVGLLLLAVVVWVFVLALQKRAAHSANLGQLQLHQDVEKRKQLFLRLLPEGSLPEPFVFRGAAELGDLSVIWMRRDYDDTHAILLGGGPAPSQDDVVALLARLGGQEQPRRQPLDEEGVEIDRRAPFAEEFRTVSPTGAAVAPPRVWAREWDGGSGGAADSGLGIDVDLGRGREVPVTGYRQSDDGYWWAFADLGPVAGDEESLYLVHAVPGEDPPLMGPMVDFLRALLDRRGS